MNERQLILALSLMGVFVLLVIGGPYLYDEYQENKEREAKREECIQYARQLIAQTPDISASNVTFDGQTLKGRIFNGSTQLLRGDAIFFVETSDCTRAGCTVIRNDLVVFENVRIPAGQARDYSARTNIFSAMDQSEINPQGRLRYNYRLDKIEPLLECSRYTRDLF